MKEYKTRDCVLQVGEPENRMHQQEEQSANNALTDQTGTEVKQLRQERVS